MMVSAEYSPEEMVNVMKLLDTDIEGENISHFYNDHPSLDERIKYLSSYLARAPTEDTSDELNRERRVLQELNQSCGTIPVGHQCWPLQVSRSYAQRLVDFHADSENLFWLAEAYRTLGPRAPQLTEKELTNSAKKDAAKNA
jgi:hypothetical protein